MTGSGNHARDPRPRFWRPELDKTGLVASVPSCSVRIEREYVQDIFRRYSYLGT